MPTVQVLEIQDVLRRAIIALSLNAFALLFDASTLTSSNGRPFARFYPAGLVATRSARLMVSAPSFQNATLLTHKS